jgi:hypothetical protein
VDLHEGLHQVWRYGDSELHAGFVGALLESPTNLAVRFAALNAYYHLMEHKRGLEEEDMLGGLGDRQMLCRGRLRTGIQALRPVAAPSAKLARFLRARQAPFPGHTSTTLG